MTLWSWLAIGVAVTVLIALGAMSYEIRRRGRRAKQKAYAEMAREFARRDRAAAEHEERQRRVHRSTTSAMNAPYGRRRADEPYVDPYVAAAPILWPTDNAAVADSVNASAPEWSGGGGESGGGGASGSWDSSDSSSSSDSGGSSSD